MAELVSSQISPNVCRMSSFHCLPWATPATVRRDQAIGPTGPMATASLCNDTVPECR